MKPEIQHQRLEPTGPAKPGETRRLMGTGLGWTRQNSVGLVFGLVQNQTDLFLWSKAGPQAGYLDPLLTLRGTQPSQPSKSLSTILSRLSIICTVKLSSWVLCVSWSRMRSLQIRNPAALLEWLLHIWLLSLDRWRKRSPNHLRTQAHNLLWQTYWDDWLIESKFEMTCNLYSSCQP